MADTGTIITTTFLNKYVIGAILIFVIFLAGGLDILMKNPVIFVFVLLVIVIINAMGK